MIASAPPFALGGPSGEPMSLDACLARGPVVLVFYKTECPTCDLAFPFLEKLHRLYGTTGLQTIGVAQNEADSVRTFVEKHGATFPQLLDRAYAVSAAYGINFTPTSFLIRPGAVVMDVVEAWTREGYNRLAARAAALVGAVAEPLSAAGDGAPPFQPG